jgi:tyrosyl-tRNA synthetase
MQEVIVREAPTCDVTRGEPLIDVLVRSGLATSKREAREFVENGAITINGAKVSDVTRSVMQEDFQSAPMALLKRGKRAVSVLTCS